VYVSDPAWPGVYRTARGRDTLAMTAVNIDARESDPRRLDMDRFAAMSDALGPGVAVKATGSDALEGVRGTNLWHWFIVAAMIAMAIELGMLIVWKR